MPVTGNPKTPISGGTKTTTTGNATKTPTTGGGKSPGTVTTKTAGNVTTKGAEGGAKTPTSSTTKTPASGTSKTSATTTTPAKTSTTSSTSPEKGPGGGRTTFRPPWVKEGSQSSQTAPWQKRNENGQTTPAPIKEAKLQSREIKVPVMTTKPKPVQIPLKPKETKPVVVESETEEEEDSSEYEYEEVEEEETEDEEDEDENEKESSPEVPLSRKNSFLTERPQLRKIQDTLAKEKEIKKQEQEKEFKLEKPKLRHVVINKDKSFSKSIETEAEPKLIRPVLRKTPKIDETAKPTSAEQKLIPSKEILKPVKKDDTKSAPLPPPPPPNMPNAPPPPPLLAPPTDFQKKPLSNKQLENLEKLKIRPRRRPDWSEMMKEVESGRKLKHVECNDRSKPIIQTKSMTKVCGQFVYETEKANVHNQLLKQIQGGIRLKPTKCNDRSKPILEGLRKFRRQMTIEEQIQKSESKATLAAENEVQLIPAPEEEEDEMDDIDKLRDDLQSTKQLLALELRNKEAQERENKRLLAKVANLEAELEREKWKPLATSEEQAASDHDDVLMKSLKKDSEDARTQCKDLEKKYQEAAEQLDSAKGEVEDQKRQIITLEKKLAQALQGISPGAASRRPSETGQKESSPEPELQMSESESDEDEEKKVERLARRLLREVKMLRTKLVRLKDKQVSAKKERAALQDVMKKNQAILKEEHKKFKKLQKEVDKMASLMKEDDDDEEKDEDEEETESETESEESEEGSGTESESESEPEDGTSEDKKKNLDPRVKRYEGRLAALKKGNYLLQANVDRLQDEINKIREKSVTLQADLDSVLSELG